MRKIAFLILILFVTSCNTTFLNQKDYEVKLIDLKWNKKIEGQVGEIYFKDSNLIYGRNYDSTFIVISPNNGMIKDTLKPYIIDNEKECLILYSLREFKNGFSLYNIPVDKQKYLKVTLKVFDRQYRGDTETFYLLINTKDNKEFTILFNRKQFTFISDIKYFKDGLFTMSFNAVSAWGDHKYVNYIGVFDIDKLLNK